MITAGWGGPDRTPGVPRRGAMLPEARGGLRAGVASTAGAGRSRAGNADASGRVHAPGELAAPRPGRRPGHPGRRRDPERLTDRG